MIRPARTPPHGRPQAHATFYRVEMLLAVNVCSVIVFHYALGMPAVGYLSAFTTACVAVNGWKTLSMDAKTVRGAGRAGRALSRPPDPQPLAALGVAGRPRCGP